MKALWASPSGEIWAAGSGLLHGSGSSWTVEEMPGLLEITAIGGTADGLVWLLGRDGLLFRR